MRFALVALALLIVTACGGSDTATPAPSPTLAPSSAETAALAYIHDGKNGAINSWLRKGWTVSCKAHDHADVGWNVQCAARYPFEANATVDQWAIFSVSDAGEVTVLVQPNAP